MLYYKKNDDLVVAGIKPYSIRSKANLEGILDKYLPIKEIQNDTPVDATAFQKTGNRFFSDRAIWNMEKESDCYYLEDYLINESGVDGNFQFGSSLFEQNDESFKKGNFVINDFDKFSIGYNFDNQKMAVLLEDNLGAHNYTLHEYKMLYPAITKFLAQTYKDSRNLEIFQKLFDLGSFDMTTLLDGGIDSLKDLREILTKCDKKEALSILCKNFPQFAKFYYGVCPSIRVNPLNSYSLEQLKRLKNETARLQLDTNAFDKIIDQEEVAENNTKVLQLVNRTK